jgi:hypothetical protein
MTKRAHICVDCSARVPREDDDSALVSMKYGWRLTRKSGSEGDAAVEWRCPGCWTAYRERRSSAGATRVPGRHGAN